MDVVLEGDSRLLPVSTADVFVAFVYIILVGLHHVFRILRIGFDGGCVHVPNIKLISN